MYAEKPCMHSQQPRDIAPISDQVMVVFTGNPASQEINGTFGAVPCESVFSAASASTLGAGNSCQFISAYVIKVRSNKLILRTKFFLFMTCNILFCLHF